MSNIVNHYQNRKLEVKWSPLMRLSKATTFLILYRRAKKCWLSLSEGRTSPCSWFEKASNPWPEVT